MRHAQLQKLQRFRLKVPFYSFFILYHKHKQKNKRKKVNGVFFFEMMGFFLNVFRFGSVLCFHSYIFVHASMLMLHTSLHPLV